jgi:hypothetical protein
LFYFQPLWVKNMQNMSENCIEFLGNSPLCIKIQILETRDCPKLNKKMNTDPLFHLKLLFNFCTVVKFTKTNHEFLRYIIFNESLLKPINKFLACKLNSSSTKYLEELDGLQSPSKINVKIKNFHCYLSI